MNLWAFIAKRAILLLIISNAWWIERVLRPLRRLAEQTDHLARGDFAAFQQPCGGIEEIGVLRRSMAHMAGHVRRAQEEGTSYRNALTNGQEAERARIARELHDDTVQSLIAIAQSIDLATNWMDKDAARAEATLKLARAQAVEAVDNLRQIIGNLRPPALEELGLIPALKMLAKDTRDMSVEVATRGVERRLNEVQELALFRSAQEAIHNACKHGRAGHVRVEVAYEPEQVSLTVIDDGRGFTMPNLDQLAEEGHFGLVGLHERVHSLNGSVRVTSAPGKGARVDVVLPVAASSQPSELVRDPVCGALIHPQQAYGSLIYEGREYFFCCPVCQGAFRRSPETYLPVEPV